MASQYAEDIMANRGSGTEQYHGNALVRDGVVAGVERHASGVVGLRGLHHVRLRLHGRRKPKGKEHGNGNFHKSSSGDVTGQTHRTQFFWCFGCDQNVTDYPCQQNRRQQTCDMQSIASAAYVFLFLTTSVVPSLETGELNLTRLVRQAPLATWGSRGVDPRIQKATALLVPQGATDEPASELLERIRKENRHA